LELLTHRREGIGKKELSRGDGMNRFRYGVLTLASCVLLPALAPAQDSSPAAGSLVAEGISNTMDKKRRNPVLTIGQKYLPAAGGKPARGQLLADASIPAPEYREYPIQFQFFVNGVLRETQFRSLELPRSIGIEVTPDVAPVPFNWTIVATLLHPNRQFTTVAQGAIFAQDLGRTYSCELMLSNVSEGGAEGSPYVADDVVANQTGNNSVSVEFASSTLADGSEVGAITASASIAFGSGTNASGTLTTTVDGRSQVSQLTGTSEAEDGAITSFDLKSADNLTTLSCSE
jgi:hypothetical protein